MDSLYKEKKLEKTLYLRHQIKLQNLLQLRKVKKIIRKVGSLLDDQCDKTNVITIARNVADII